MIGSGPNTPQAGAAWHPMDEDGRWSLPSWGIGPVCRHQVASRRGRSNSHGCCHPYSQHPPLLCTAGYVCDGDFRPGAACLLGVSSRYFRRDRRTWQGCQIPTGPVRLWLQVTNPRDDDMWVGVLGALEVRDEQRTVVVPGKMRTTLLAALVCRAPRIVPAHQLVEDLWGLTPPPSADKTLQSHLVRLRQDLGPSGGSVHSDQRPRLSHRPYEGRCRRSAFQRCCCPGRAFAALRASRRTRWTCWMRRWGGGAVMLMRIFPIVRFSWPSGRGWRNCVCAPRSGGRTPRWRPVNRRV